MTCALGTLQELILHSPGLHKKTHFLQMLISQARNNISKIFQSQKPTTHRVLLTGAIGTLQELILHSPGLQVVCQIKKKKKYSLYSR